MISFWHGGDVCFIPHSCKMSIDLLLYLLYYFLSIPIFTGMCIFIFALLSFFLCGNTLLWIIIQLFSNENVLRNHFNLDVWGRSVAHPTSRWYVTSKYRKKYQKRPKNKDMNEILAVFLGQGNKTWDLIGELEVLGRQPECYSSHSKCNNSNRKRGCFCIDFNDLLRMLPKKT